nr:ERI1 exoribonuclease 3-like isoform X2 [Lepeophtheirus salmonis]
MLPTFVSTRSTASKLPSWMTKIPSTSKHYEPQKFNYFYVMDFEATCLSNTTIEPQEIIEIPVLAVNGKTFEVEETFHNYVKPIANPQLSRFCTELTGITQDVVDGSRSFIPVFNELKQFCESRSNFTFVTCGDWDLKIMLPNQCRFSGVEIPEYMKTWINIKKSYNRAMGSYPRRLDDLLLGCGLKFEGRAHSGIDDATNIAKALRSLAIEHHYVFNNTFFQRPT